MDSSPPVKSDPRRRLPAVDRLANDLRNERPDLPGWAVLEASRRVLASERERLTGGRDADGSPGATDVESLRERAAAVATGLAVGHPRRVVNATGIVLHTNLGRAPLAPGAVAAGAEAASSYSDLELDLASGKRGDRQASVAEKLCVLTDAPAALAVNNNAAALLLALDTLARGREVIVSRGELVEIGGSFRVPEIMERAGVRLVEVGSTNRTHAADYERAIGPETALLLKVHLSNFEQKGFVAEVTLTELAEIGRARGIPVLEDLGSGTLIDLGQRGFPTEADAAARLRLGADVVCFSGDKLLGGPQAGLLLGAADRVAAMKRNPLARALRLDKFSLAALDWTLATYLDGRAEREIPVLRQLLASTAELEASARALADRLAKVAGDAAQVSAEPERSFVGGGSLPGFELHSWVVSVRPEMGVERFVEALRRSDPPILARVRDEVVRLDVRTLLPGDETAVEHAVTALLAPNRVDRGETIP